MIPSKVKRFLDSLVGRSENTISNYTSFANVFWEHIKKPVEEVTIQDITAFLKWGVDKQGWKLSTMVQYAKTAQRFMSEFKDDDFLKSLKKQIQMLPKPGQYSHLYEGIYIPGDQIDAFIKAAESEEYAVAFTMILKWGLRLDEVLNMTTDDIDAKIARVVVRGKGQGKEHKVRPVWVDRKSMQRVLFFKGYNHEQSIGSKPLGRKRGIVSLSKRSIQYAWKRAGNKIGLKHWKQLTPHDGRHSYAIDFLIRRKDQGMPALVLLKNQLGHSNINTTMIYLDIAGTEARDIFEAGLKE